MDFSMILSVFSLHPSLFLCIVPLSPSSVIDPPSLFPFPTTSSYYPLSRMLPHPMVSFYFSGFCSYFMLYTHSWRPTNERGHVTLFLCAWVTPLSVFSGSSFYPQISWFRFTLQINIISLYTCTTVPLLIHRSKDI